MNFHCIILYIYSSAVCDLSNGSANSAEFLNIRKIMGLLMCPLLRGFIWIFITYVDWLIDWLIIYITYMHLLENIPFKWRPYRRRGRAAKFRPFLNAFNLWAGWSSRFISIVPNFLWHETPVSADSYEGPLQCTTIKGSSEVSIVARTFTDPYLLKS